MLGWMDKLENIKRIKVKVSGIVQGVGFRPTVYRYAHEHGLTGHVMNTSEGVTIEVQGKESDIEEFLNKVLKHPPALAKITGFDVENIRPAQDNDFLILLSNQSGYKDAEISPDVSICKDCVSDIFDTSNRRYLYPFTNCTNCGPRFSIINDRPYDRKNTSMHSFKMCDNCQQEYNDPTDRRFHAQPNACPKCGPSIKLLSLNGTLNDQDKVIPETVSLIKSGAIVAIKSIGGFNIACDPFNEGAVKRLRIKKDRPSKAFAIMARDVRSVETICHLSEKEKEIITSKTAPIVLLKKRDTQFNHISPDNNYIGVVLPFTPLHHVLFKDLEFLIMTSANRADEPIAIDDQQVYGLMKDEIIDYSLTHNREIINRCDDSVVQVINDDIQVIRRARGFVPRAFNVGSTVWGDNVSLGANLKNTFSIKKKNRIYMSQHIGDLNDMRNYDYQKEELAKFIKLLDFKTDRINIDSHPGYENYNPKHNKIYHHHAHALSVMAEHGLLGKRVLGVICDGTGYGADGNIWGFEFLDVEEDYREFKRLGHLKYFVLPGGERAIDEVDRIAVSLSRNTGHSRFINEERRRIIKGIIDKNINCPVTSSLGRLFDGVASICGVIQKVTYEAQAAIILQKYAEMFFNKLDSKYKVSIKDNILDHGPMIEELIKDIDSGMAVEECAYKFHVWVAGSITAFVSKVTPKYVVFSGGCFQNSLLCTLLSQEMKTINIEHFFNHEIPTNDAGVSFGQSLL
jgi:hydrogenase maturation protein HypF